MKVYDKMFTVAHGNAVWLRCNTKWQWDCSYAQNLPSGNDEISLKFLTKLKMRIEKSACLNWTVNNRSTNRNLFRPSGFQVKPFGLYYVSCVISYLRKTIFSWYVQNNYLFFIFIEFCYVNKTLLNQNFARMWWFIERAN